MRAPLYFDGGAGRCYATLFSLRDAHATPTGAGCPTACLFVPPFAEEMNKSRRMAALLASSLAESGAPTLLPDLWGTGDSGGDFKDARWDVWRADLQAAVGLLADRGASSVGLVALRFGALLALDVLGDLPLPVTRLVLWQPVISGGQYLTQFLRLRVASALADGGGATVRGVREELERVGSVEIGGYELALELARSIEGARLDAAASEIATAVHWLDVSSDPERPLSVPAQQVVEAWRRAGVSVAVERVRGDAFWATQEITEVPDLVAATTRLFAAPPHQPADATTSLGSEHPVTIAREPPPAACREGPRGEQGIVFDCGGDELVGVLHSAGASASTGVLVVVGGPQYRVGSHRQFVLLARVLATCGIPVLRFDCRGMGDSAGASRDFERIADDIAVAIDGFQRAVPSIRRVVVWGLCDAATAAASYAPRDPRVCGLVLLNPWVRTAEGAAQAHLRHYYHRRLLEPDFWRKLAGLRLDVRHSWRSFVELVQRSGWVAGRASRAAGVPLPERLAGALGEFTGHCLIVLSGNDLTAAEFRDCVAASTKWQGIVSRPTVTRLELAAADHTFSRREWRDQVATWTADWVRARWPVPGSEREAASAPG